MHGWCKVARVSQAKGLQGKLRLVDASAFLCFLESDTLSEEHEICFIPPRIDCLRFGTVDEVQVSSSDECVITLSELNSLDEAEQLVGCSVLMQGSFDVEVAVFDKRDQYVGYDVVDSVLGNVGRVTYFDSLRPQPLLTVQSNNAEQEKDILIPFVEGIIESISHNENCIYIQLPKGLLDL